MLKNKLVIEQMHALNTNWAVLKRNNIIISKKETNNIIYVYSIKELDKHIKERGKRLLKILEHDCICMHATGMGRSLKYKKKTIIKNFPSYPYHYKKEKPEKP